MAWSVCLMVMALLEAVRIRDRLLIDGTPGNWSDLPNLDATFFLPWLLLAPFCWLYPCRSSPAPSTFRKWLARFHIPTGVSAAVILLLVLVIHWHTSRQLVPSTGHTLRLCEVVPLIHDEFSYQLQARTFLQGKWFIPGPVRAPELFHQMHVLNEGRFASRYPPGTGLWLAPWEAWGHPGWGQLAAHVLVSLGLFGIGRELDSPAAGLIAGTLAAVSPGLALFSQLLLAHLPTLVGIVLFLWGFLRVMSAPTTLNAFIAGSGLSLAMLCRPLTAAAVALPFGLWWLQAICRSNRLDGSDFFRRRLKATAGIVIPIGLGLALIGWQNRILTGDPLHFAYSHYTNLYTPRHAYGFQNGERSPTEPAKHLRDYDVWAENLTLPLAWKNVTTRCIESARYTLGIVPVLLAGFFFLGTWRLQDRRLQLIFAAIVSQHAAHVPYWLDGLLGFHYVFESLVLWLLIFAVVSMQALRHSLLTGRWLFPAWWGGLVLLAVLSNHVELCPQSPSRLARGIALLTASSGGYQRFQNCLTDSPFQKPALVLVSPTLNDLHVQFVRNAPPFDAEVLVGTDRPDLYTECALHDVFPERTIYRYESSTGTITAAGSER